MEYFNYLKDFFFPKLCFRCGKNGNYLCKKCFSENQRINIRQICHVCGREVRLGFMHENCKDGSFIDGLIYITNYTDLIKKLIHEGKYNGIYEIFNELGIIMGQYLKSYYKFHNDNCVLSFVPLSKHKQKYRGFNQAELMAKKIGFETGISVMKVLEKSKNSKSQAGSSEEARQQNLKGTFSPIDHVAFDKNKVVIIVDDVFTTGGTINECSKIIKSIGTKTVYGLTFAKSREWKSELSL